MVKDKVSLGYRMQHWFTHHPWLKLIALGLAVMLWFYIRGAINRTAY
ncbi:MAG: hypothetical protein ACM3OC_06230 [Deltaproteobacteria bacterium]